MHPSTLLFSLAALASVVVSTKHKGPGTGCPEDEYYSKMMESKNRNAAYTDCTKWLSGTITDAKKIPEYLKDCTGNKDEERAYYFFHDVNYLTVAVTSTIPVSTTICPVTETPRPGPPNEKPTTVRATSTIYSTSTYTLTRCPPGATYCPVDNLPITTIIPVGTTVLTITDAVPTPEHSNQGGSNTGKEVSPAETSPAKNNGSPPGDENKGEGIPTQTGGSNVDSGKPGQAPTTSTVVTVQTTTHTITNGISAQILTVVPVTSTLAAGNGGNSLPIPPSTAEAGPHASPTDAPLKTTAWQPTEASRSGLDSQPTLPASSDTVTASTSPRPSVVTAGALGLAGSNGVQAAFLVFALVALL
ncbi:hypothetical protein F5883DRAFT_695991 [Diaporthe sp. PMI_573]|nr:hypothetical protein F5883DRAFT_695991 [Diaporthaceae sp. PMI_573]